MRVLDVDLEAELDGNPDPYLQLQYTTAGIVTWHDAPYPVIGYKLGDKLLTVNTAGNVSATWYAVRLKRGAYINKVPNYVTSSIYYVHEMFVTQKERVTITASLFPKGTQSKFSTDGNQSYKTIIDAICAAYGYTALYEDDAAAFWDNIFLPAGRTLTLQSPHSIFTLLRQKLFIYAQDNNEGEIYFRQWLDDGDIGTGSYPSLETIVTFDWKTQYSKQQRVLLWRDEASTVHYWPNPVLYHLPYYNLGYLESTAEVAQIYRSWHANEDKRTFHLKYQDGDIIHCSSGTYQIQVFEVFDPKVNPTLYLQFTALPKFSTTEGGPIPGTIEAAAPYTPLNVSNFNGILDDNDNNLQAAMETIDDHSHPVWLPFGVYTSINPITSSGQAPYAATIDRAMTFKSWFQFVYIATTNDGTNYWKIQLIRMSDGAVIKEINTSALSANTGVTLSTTSFTISSVVASALGMYVSCLKQGSPGNLYIFGPALEVVV